jgi:ribosomal small subunit protein bTHX
MGKGDKKSRKGKITIGSHGVLRPRKKVKAKTAIANNLAAPVKKKVATEKAAPVKKAATAEKVDAPKKAAAPKKTASKKAE